MNRQLQTASSPRDARMDVDRIFHGGGGMGELMASVDWSTTLLGPVTAWPASLRTIVRVMLASRHPMAAWWGPQCVHLYNDAYCPILGDIHPRSLGAPGVNVWGESWEIIGPMAAGVLNGGRATWNENFLFPVNRRGFLEETYFTFSYSPIPDDDGNTGGVLVTTKETTAEVLHERQMRTLSDLANVSANANDTESALKNAAAVLASNRYDFPFALLYRVDHAARCAHLVCTEGLQAAPEAVQPASIGLDANDNAPWPLARSLQGGAPLVIDDLLERVGPMPGGGWPEAPSCAVILPLLRPGSNRPYGFLVSGANSRRLLDDSYLDFFRLAADAITTGISNARALEDERHRVEALAELDRVKTAFFSNVSHEFRTPLTLMLGPTEDLLHGVHGRIGGTQRTQLEMLHRNALRLQKLVNTLLDYSRLETGRIKAVFEPVDLVELTADSASAFRSIVEEAGLAFVIDCEPIDEAVYVDRDMWEKVVLNLVSNAFKFTFSGEIRVSLRGVAGRAELHVSDTGIGVPPGEIPRLFERFHRVRGARARTHEGSGIGLAFVQEIVRLHGGEIHAESTLDEGSRFVVSIPFGHAHLPVDHVCHSPSSGNGISSSVSFLEEARSWHDPAALEHRPGHAAVLPGPSRTFPGASAIRSGGRILLVDDNPDMLDYIRRVLEPHWDVDACRDGNRGIASARANPPDLVLTDVMMPGADGFALLQALRSDRRTRHVPVLMLSARAGEESRIEGLEAGAEDYLVKPFSARELLARVNTQLELGKLRQQIDAERRKLANVFNDAPVAIAVWRGPQHVFEIANPRYLQIVGRRDVIGRTVRDVFADEELERRGLWKIWDRVYATGETSHVRDCRVPLDRGGGREEVRFAFTLSALHGDGGEVNGLVAIVMEVENDEVRLPLS